MNAQACEAMLKMGEESKQSDRFKGSCLAAHATQSTMKYAHTLTLTDLTLEMTSQFQAGLIAVTNLSSLSEWQ